MGDLVCPLVAKTAVASQLLPPCYWITMSVRHVVRPVINQHARSLHNNARVMVRKHS